MLLFSASSGVLTCVELSACVPPTLYLSLKNSLDFGVSPPSQPRPECVCTVAGTLILHPFDHGIVTWPPTAICTVVPCRQDTLAVPRPRPSLTPWSRPILTWKMEGDCLSHIGAHGLSRFYPVAVQVLPFTHSRRPMSLALLCIFRCEDGV